MLSNLLRSASGALALTATLLATTAPASAQEVRVFEMNPSTGQLVHWQATSNLGPMGAFLQSYSFGGDVVVDFDLNPSAGRARITGARLRVPNTVVAAVQGGGPATVFWRDLVLTMRSPDFNVVPAFPWAVFSTTVDLRVSSGFVEIDPPLGPAISIPIDGMSLGTIAITGAFPTVGPAQAMSVGPFRFDMDFAAPGFTGTFTHEVTALEATGSCPEPLPYCTSPGGTVLDTAGSTSVGQDDFNLAISGAPASSFGVPFYGSRAASIPSGDGTLCVGGTLVRLPIVQTDPTGSAFVPVSLSTVGTLPFAAGSHRNFQFWHRTNSPMGTGWDFSNAVAVTFCP